MARPSSRETILQAAEAIVIESGAVRMTLDAVAERSGISKGGLMYHFSTKEALLQAMIERMAVRFEGLRTKAREEMSEEHTTELMVEIRMFQGWSEEDHRLGAALLAVTANQPELVRTMREVLRDRFFNHITSRDNFTETAILFFAAFGMHFHDLINLSLLDKKQKTEIYEKLMRHARGFKDAEPTCEPCREICGN